MTVAADSRPDQTQIIADAWRSAVACHRAGRAREAEDLYTEILRVHPAHADAHHNLGVLLVSATRYEQALPHLVAAIETEPTVAQYWLSYVDALATANRRDEALNVLALARAHGLQGAAVEGLAAKLQK